MKPICNNFFPSSLFCLFLSPLPVTFFLSVPIYLIRCFYSFPRQIKLFLSLRYLPTGSPGLLFYNAFFRRNPASLFLMFFSFSIPHPHFFFFPVLNMRELQIFPFSLRKTLLSLSGCCCGVFFCFVGVFVVFLVFFFFFFFFFLCVCFFFCSRTFLCS